MVAASLGSTSVISRPRRPARPPEGPEPRADDAAWIVSLGWQLGPLDGQGAYLVLDPGDGHVVQRSHWITWGG